MKNLFTTTSLMLLTLTWLAIFGLSAAWGYQNEYVKEACSVTRYQDLCIHTLASYSRTARKSPSKWARAGLSVALTEVKSVAEYLSKLKAEGQMKGRQRGALKDCIECLQDSIYNLHRSLRILRNLKGEEFDSQMNDLITWMSSSLTDEDTCLDGFEGEKGNQVKMLHDKVVKVTYLTSNALALANKLASTGLRE